MPKQTQETTIDGVPYRVTQLGATTGGQIMFRLGRAFGAVVAGLRVGNVTLDALDPADFDWLVKTLQPATKVGIVDVAGGGKVNFVDLPHVFEDHFAGRYPQMLEWLKFSLEVNYGPLQGALGSLFRGAMALSPSISPKASTGSPLDSSSAPASTSAHS
jgi:hypothetical protein